MSDETRRALSRLAGDGDEAAAVALLIAIRREHDGIALDAQGRCARCFDHGWVVLQAQWPLPHDAVSSVHVRCPYCPRGANVHEPPVELIPPDAKRPELYAILRRDEKTFKSAAVLTRLWRIITLAPEYRHAMPPDTLRGLFFSMPTWSEFAGVGPVSVALVETLAARAGLERAHWGTPYLITPTTPGRRF